MDQKTPQIESFPEMQDLSPKAEIVAKRLYYLDNLKLFLTIIVIVHHSTLLSLTGELFFYSLPYVGGNADGQYDLLSRFITFNASYFMSLFFFVSALFVPSSLRRKGARRFVLDKLKRYGIPLILTIVLIDPIAFGIGKGPTIGFWNEVMLYWPNFHKDVLALNFQFGVAWFLWILLLFSIAYALLEVFCIGKTQKQESKKSFPAFLQIACFSVAIIPFNFAASYAQDLLGENFLGLHHLKDFPLYVSMFIFGIMAEKNDWLESLTMKVAFPWIMLATVLSAIFTGDILWLEMVIRPFTVVGISMLLLYSFRHAYNQTSSFWSRFCSDSYSAYLVQLIPIAVTGVFYERYMTTSPIINAILTSLLAVLLSYLAADILKHAPVLKRII